MKKNDEKVETMLDQMSHAFSDPEVQKREDIKTLIFNSAKELEKTEYPDMVSFKLCKSLVLTYLAKKEEYPKAAIVLLNQLRGKEVKYDGIAASAMLLPIWF